MEKWIVAWGRLEKGMKFDIMELHKEDGEMLDKNDLDILRNMMESVVNERLSKSENLVLDEMERTRGILEKQIEKLERKTA